jgi:AraC family transcriptional regulator of adaptative response/methylated-DNA-[protein]-cysteine methyltransferase
VWEALLAIPEGRLASYSSIAHDINQARAARAVGSAVAKNPVAYLIPCHRVIKNMGVIGNYRWGELRKQAMVGRELASKLTD